MLYNNHTRFQLFASEFSKKNQNLKIPMYDAEKTLRDFSLWFYYDPEL